MTQRVRPLGRKSAIRTVESMCLTRLEHNKLLTLFSLCCTCCPCHYVKRAAVDLNNHNKESTTELWWWGAQCPSILSMKVLAVNLRTYRISIIWYYPYISNCGSFLPFSDEGFGNHAVRNDRTYFSRWEINFWLASPSYTERSDAVLLNYKRDWHQRYLSQDLNDISLQCRSRESYKWQHRAFPLMWFWTGGSNDMIRHSQYFWWNKRNRMSLNLNTKSPSK